MGIVRWIVTAAFLSFDNIIKYKISKVTTLVILSDSGVAPCWLLERM